MRIVVFGPARRVGAWQDERIVDLNSAFAVYAAERLAAPDPGGLSNERMPADLAGLIARGPAGLDDAREALQFVGTRNDVSVMAREVKLHAPAIYRPRIACAGGNYAAHAAGAQEARTGQPVDVLEVYRQSRAGGPWGFWKVVDPLWGDGDPVIIPARATHFDYEAEVAVVLGRSARDLRAEHAREAIWGVTLFNDWSVRNDMGPGRVLNFNMAKNFDTSVSLGPSIVVDDFDPQNVDVELRIDGRLRQHYNTRDMTFSFAEFLEHLSRDFTFQPGDMLAGGTGAGTALDTSRPGPDGKTPTDLFLKVGQRVEVSSPGIGTLRNHIVAKD
jgi:2-keto-4-pentenoate hydratase/2-oxohepta-3-ene-1,7-dioic acid hydratase in catechol pathway